MVPSVPMPAELLAAAREARDDDELAVRLEIAGVCVIAVIGGEGDPREWWTAIWQIAGPDASVPLTESPRLQSLPAGLSALAVRRGVGDPALSVSDAIDPERQRAAVQAALHAARRADRRDGVPLRPARLDTVLARLGAFVQPSRIRAAVAMAAVVLVAASVAIAVSLGRQHQEQSAGLSVPGLAAGSAQNQAAGQSGRGAAPAVTTGGTGPASGAAGASGSPTARGRAKPTSHLSASPTGSRGPSPSPSAPGSPTPSPSQPPGPTPTTPAPSSEPPPSQSPPPSPTPSASPTGSGSCVVILGIQVCV